MVRTAATQPYKWLSLVNSPKTSCPVPLLALSIDSLVGKQRAGEATHRPCSLVGRGAGVQRGHHQANLRG